jgi:hypothetical protein
MNSQSRGKSYFVGIFAFANAFREEVLDACGVVIHLLFSQLLQSKDSFRVTDEDFGLTVSDFTNNIKNKNK